MALTIEKLRALQPGDVLMEVCKTPEQVESYLRIAYNAREEFAQQQKPALEVSRSFKTMTVVVRRADA